MHYDHLTTGWRLFPGGLKADGQVVAIPDIHGRADLLERALAVIEALPEPHRGAERNLVFLGDLIDRGPEGLRAIRLAMNARLGGRPATVLPGNHEGMMLDGLDTPLDTGAFQFWYEVGGSAVLDELPCGGVGTREELRRKLREALPAGFLDLLRGGGPTHHLSGDLLLVHGGVPPYGMDLTKAQLGRNTPRTLPEFLAQPLADAPRFHWAWMRQPFLDWTGGWDAERRLIVVHGHTVEHPGPLRNDAETFAAADHVEEKRRIGLDTGAVFFGRLVFLEAIDHRYRFHVVRQERHPD